MAKMMPEKERKMRKFVAAIGKGTKRALDAYGWAKSPHIKVVESAADRMSRADDLRKIRGAQRNRVQYLNPKTQRWVKVDTKTGKIVGHKKTPGPYKNVRKMKNRTVKRKGRRR